MRSLRARDRRSAGGRPSDGCGNSIGGPAEVASAAASWSPTCSRRTSGVPVSTWLPVVTSSSLTRAGNGACRTVSIFIDSSTMTGRARLDLVTDGDRRGDHEGRGRRTLHAALVAGDAVGDAVDLDQRGRAVGGRDHVVPLAADHEPSMELVEAVQLGLDGRGAAADRDRHLVARRTGVEGRDLVGGAAELDLDGTAGPVLDLRSTAVRGLQQPGDLQLDLVGVRLDGGSDDRHPGLRVRDEASLGTHAVDPAGVGPATGAVDDLGLGEQVEHEALVAGAALDHDGGLAHGPCATGPGPPRACGRPR